MRLLLFFLLAFQITYAHKGTLSGIVKETDTDKPLPGATLLIQGKYAVSNDFGQFVFRDLESGASDLVVSAIGYHTQKVRVELIEDENTNLTLHLQRSNVSLEEIKINSVSPHKLNLISHLDIQVRPIQNSQEILRFVPGLLMGQHAGGGKAEQIFLRGFDIDHGTDILLSADGMPVNMVSHAHGQGYADLHFLIPELIENVSFQKGMYHADKGNFSTAGWVDFKTKNVLDRNIFKAEVGQFNTYRGLGALNILKKENQSAYMAGEYQYSDAYFDAPQKFNRYNFLSKYHVHWKNTSFNLSASTFGSTWNHSGQIPERAVASGMIGFFGAIDPTEGGETHRTNVNLQTSTLTSNHHIFKNQVYYTHYDFLLYSNFTFFLENPEFGDQIKQKENRNLFGYNGSYHIPHGKGEFSAGLNYRQDLTKDSELSNTHNKTQVLNAIMLGDIREANLGIYVDETFDLNAQWKLNLGLRYDYFFNRYLDHLDKGGKTSAGILLPKVNVYYSPTSTLQFYFNSGKGFHSNDTRVAVPQNGKEVLPAAYGTDLGVNAKLAPRLFVNAAYWNLWLDQEFVYVGDAGIVEPSGKTWRQGLDLSLRYELGKNLFLDTDLNWTRPRALEEEDHYIPLAPIFTSMGGLTYKRKEGLNGSLRYRYVADRPANEDNSIIAKGYFINDLQMNYTKPSYQIGLSIQNLFDQRWKETQFNTLSRLRDEAEPVEEIHFTPGTPFSAKLSFSLFF